MTQRFGRRAVYVVIGDGVEEETVAKKVRFSKPDIITISSAIVIEGFLIRRYVNILGISLQLFTAYQFSLIY